MKKKILISIKESAGDVFLITGLLKPLKDKFPDFNIYVACDPKYKNILEENPYIKKVLPWDDSMYDYRSYTKFAHMDNIFDIHYCPAIETQVHPHNWLNGDYAYFLGDFYANRCNVKYDEPYIKWANVEKFNLPPHYITVQNQSGQKPKNYDELNQVTDALVNTTIVQLGAKDDKLLDHNGSAGFIDLRGQTTFQEAASVIRGAACHIGLDSVLMHLAGHVETKSVIVFGGTLHQAGINPRHKPWINVIEPYSRGTCITSCHLVNCHAEERGWHRKCTHNVPVKTVVDKVRSIVGENYINYSEPTVSLSAYMVIRDGQKYQFPYGECINQALKIEELNEFIIVDGGSTDGTYESLLGIARNNHKIKLYRQEWDLDKPGFLGDAKAHAASLCTGTHRLQLDADEIIVEPKPGLIKQSILQNLHVDCINYPVFNFYGDEEHIRIENHCWKFRITKNDKNITHGPHGMARIFDTELGQIVANKNASDYCDQIYEDSLEIVTNSNPLEAMRYMMVHEQLKSDKSDKSINYYKACLNYTIKTCPHILHYSWKDLDRKKANGGFWDQTAQVKHQQWHNSSEDIGRRIEENKDFIIDVSDIEFKTSHK
jgi:ADP-heptose:LPS heptosyltransferase/glycosyltransferase involved in cell wall biosynthesis